MEKLQEGVKELMYSGLSLSTIVKMCKDIYRKKRHEEIYYNVSPYGEGDDALNE